MDFDFEWKGLEEIVDNYSKMVDDLIAITDKALMMASDTLLLASSYEVPHDIGTLQNSGSVKKEESENPNEIAYSVGYYTPYAHRLHEHPEYNFQDGRKGKFLEDPLNKNALGWQDKLFSIIESEFAKL